MPSIDRQLRDPLRSDRNGPKGIDKNDRCLPSVVLSVPKVGQTPTERQTPTCRLSCRDFREDRRMAPGSQTTRLSEKWWQDCQWLMKRQPNALR